MPFRNDQSGTTDTSNTNTFGFQSFDPENPFVRDYMNEDIAIDPGARQRTDLAEQASQNRWNNAFTAGIPQLQRMMAQGAEQRGIQRQGAEEAQNAAYKQKALRLARAQSLLPQLVQTGGTSHGTTTGISSGFNSAPGQNGFWNTMVGGVARGLGGALGSGFGYI